ncbi:hypothetical protein HaLaN_25887, partial [Haematococcus lacustris]
PPGWLQCEVQLWLPPFLQYLSQEGGQLAKVLPNDVMRGWVAGSGLHPGVPLAGPAGPATAGSCSRRLQMTSSSGLHRQER